MNETKKYSYGASEVKRCYFCNSKLIPLYKTYRKVYFASGHQIRLAHMIYKCSNENCLKKGFKYKCLSLDKLAPKGIRYSYKILLEIYVLYLQGKTREDIEYILNEKGIDINSKTVFNLKNKYNQFISYKYDDLKTSLSKIYQTYKDIKLSFDFSWFSTYAHLIIRDGFVGDVIEFKFFKDFNQKQVADFIDSIFKLNIKISEIRICPELFFICKEIEKYTDIKPFVFPENNESTFKKIVEK